MPRVIIGRENRKANEFTSWLYLQMKLNKKRQEDMGKLLNITQQAFGKRLRDCNFSYKEMLKIFDYFKATDEEILKYMKY